MCVHICIHIFLIIFQVLLNNSFYTKYFVLPYSIDIVLILVMSQALVKVSILTGYQPMPTICKCLQLATPANLCSKYFPFSIFQIPFMNPFLLCKDKKYSPDNGNPGPTQSKKQVSQCIHQIWMCHWILENEHRHPIIHRVHTHTKVNGWAKYEHDLWNIVGCRVVMRAGWTERWTDR